MTWLRGLKTTAERWAAGSRFFKLESIGGRQPAETGVDGNPPLRCWSEE
jgi:hypothetical protein